MAPFKMALKPEKNSSIYMTFNKKQIHSPKAPAAIGPYSQAIAVGNTVYLSGQIPLQPETMELLEGDLSQQTHQVFKNLRAVAAAAGGELSDMVKLTIYLTDLTAFPIVNEIMEQYFSKPYPARATIGVQALPKGAQLEIEAVMVIAGKS